jgi:hypothetical protein
LSMHAKSYTNMIVPLQTPTIDPNPSFKFFSNATIIVPLQNLRSNPSTSTSIIKTRCNKTTWYRLVGNTWMKRNYSLFHKTMAKMTEKGIILLIKWIDCIHVNNLLMEENWACIHELLLEKQLEYFKTQDKYINWNQENMVRIIINLVAIMNMVFFKTTQNNNNSSNTIDAPKNNMVNDKWFSYWIFFIDKQWIDF